MVLERLFGKKEERRLIVTRNPRHLAVVPHGTLVWSKRQSTSLTNGYAQGFQTVRRLAAMQVKHNIPIISVLMLSAELRNSPQYRSFEKPLQHFFESLNEDPIIHKNQIRVGILGKWYDLPSDIVGSIKTVLDETKDYDRFFLNVCINYDGQDEIVDACRLIVKKVELQKLREEDIDKEVLKDNLYSSYFLPPDMFVVTGGKKFLSGLLLWDSARSKVYFSPKLWPDFDNDEMQRALAYFQK